MFGIVHMYHVIASRVVSEPMINMQRFHAKTRISYEEQCCTLVSQNQGAHYKLCICLYVSVRGACRELGCDKHARCLKSESKISPHGILQFCFHAVASIDLAYV